MSQTAAELIAIGLRRSAELPAELPLRLPSAETTDFTVRIPVADDQLVRSIAHTRDRSIAIVTGALIQLGLRHHHELPGQIPVQCATRKELPLTKAS
ncbi:hypothetical protein [Pseudonocardia parietis]|uniref:Uncharacterized protein n=1 Tax=Pseudonocardia parietis TaxID=570936 RepID=A0ABS4W6N9_9PSEU|nr:hypothetical protein [Pseudonocardia parietis]MBP2371651.1 hypothetical protein [Pseudonocardia parietis]